MLSPLLYSLFTHDCTDRHDSKTIIKFADDTTDNDETAYKEEVKDLAKWGQNNNLSLNVAKTKEEEEKEHRARPHSPRRDCSGAD
jgi:hypothetical protein